MYINLTIKTFIMKKTFLLAILAVLCVGAPAQTIVPRAGLTVTTNSVSTDNFNSGGKIKSQTGFTFGVGVIVPVTPILSLQPELNYIQKGFAYEFSEDDGFSYYEQSQKLKYSYLEVPVLLRLSLGPDVAKIHVNLGPSLGYGLGGKTDFRSFTDPGDGIPPYEEKGEAKVKFEKEPAGYEGEDVYLEKRLDIGLQAGAGVTLLNKITVDIRYGMGLTNVTENNVQGDTKNRVIQFTVGVPLSLF